MPPIRDRSPHDRRPAKSLADRIATSTTRLILIAVVAGGLLTIAWNLRGIGPSDSDESPLNQTDLVAPVDDLLREGFPVSQVLVKGDEAAARAAVVKIGREKMGEAALKVVALQKVPPPARTTDDAFAGSTELANDPDGKWSIRQLDDLRRLIIGLAMAGPQPTVVFWGGYDETAPGEWTTWTMLLPLPESEELK
ncbi:hypothetical protein AYO47_03580 [Planctomyces sp. SCGC AG-212-M04]|nr:hypothetical protein AYO47_03580 [Planctomyces sp. SCGC AG-212-M04]